jgi:isoquinoline 1-oxidoreductase alpha subunit
MSTSSRLIFGITIFLTISQWLRCSGLSVPHCSAIHSAVGMAQLRKSQWLLPHGVETIGNPVTKPVAATHNEPIGNLFFSNNSNLHCHRIGTRSFWRARSASARWVSDHSTNVNSRRKRHHAPAGEETMPNLNINGRSMSVDAANDTPLLWAIREQLQMTGTKFGCGAGLCGACTVHVNGEAVRSCQTAVGDVAGKKITTIEGLSARGDHPLQKAWITEQVPQCGYCQSGQIMQAAALLSKNANPTRDEVVAHMDGNLCRCMTYSRIQKAIMRAASEMRTASNTGTERRAT